MSITIQVNHRGTITLPKALRRRLGVERGGVLIADETGASVTLRAGVTLPIEIYSDERVREFDAAEAELQRHLARTRR